MARQRMVTRTMVTSICKILCVDVETNDTKELTFKLPGIYKSDKQVLKAVEAVLEADIDNIYGNEIKPVFVVCTNTEKHLYGMTEQSFLDNAKEIVKNNSKEDK